MMKLTALHIPLLFFLFSSTLSAQPYELESIEFYGNNAFSSGHLKEIIYSQESPGGFWQFIKSISGFGSDIVYFEERNIEIDIEALESFYRANGFFDVSVKGSVQRGKESAVLIYTITEGPPYFFGRVKAEGFEDFPEQYNNRITDNLSVDSTDRFSEDVLLTGIDNLLFYLQNDGYLFSGFDSSRIFIDTSNDRADCKIHFTLGDQYRTEELRIDKKGTGKESVSDKLIRDLVALNDSTIYSPELMRQTENRLYRTELFTTVSLSAVKEEADSGLVPVLLDGTIGEMNELGPEIIANNQQNALNLGLAIDYRRKNFLGNARILQVGTSFGIRDPFSESSNLFNVFDYRDTTVFGFYGARLKLEQPRIFDLNAFGSLEFSIQQLKYENLSFRTYDAVFKLDFEVPRFTFINSLETFYRLSSLDFFVVGDTPEETRDAYFSIAGLGATVKSLKSNDVIFPTEGYNLILSVEEGNGIPYAVGNVLSISEDVRPLFYKTKLTSSIYFSLDRKDELIFAANGTVGYLHTYIGDFGELAPNYRFYTGGSNSLRGWRARELGPRYKTGEDDNFFGTEGDVVGGAFLLETSFEIRYKIAQSFGVALFTDLGNVWRTPNDFTYDQVAIAAGLGPRIYTDFVSFRLDLGMKVYNPDNQRTILDEPFLSNIEIHFGIGEAF